MAPFPRSISLAMFRAHLENGLWVAIGVGLSGIVLGTAIDFQAGVVAGTGALCVSISDRTDPLRQKLLILGIAFVCTGLFTALASFCEFRFAAFFAATLFCGLWAGLVSAYGRWALSLAMTSVLAFVFAMGRHFNTLSQAASHLLLIMLGALIYTGFAIAIASLFDDRSRRLLLGEAMRAFADYLRAKAILYDHNVKGPAALRAVIDAHAILADRLQAARDSLFARRSHRTQLKRIDALIALLDAFETTLSSDADLDVLRRVREPRVMERLSSFARMMADEVEELTLALRSPRSHVAPHSHAREAQQLKDSIAAAGEAASNHVDFYAFVSTCDKLILADSYVQALGLALDDATPPSDLAVHLDLDPFRQPTPGGILPLLSQLNLHAPALRYAVRLSLALTSGLTVTRVFPHFAHANWVLLTIALIMRANYSVTRQRRWHRVTGTLIGCALAVLFIDTLSASWLLLLIVLAVGISHAYATVQYRVTAIGASISSLLLLHFIAPLVHPQFFERIVDTLIGSALSWAFSYLLPSWERDDVPRTVKSLLAADAVFADAALRRDHVRQQYRLARKKAIDAVAQLSGAIRRLADEPNLNRRALAGLVELLGANYLLASNLSSMPILIKLRGEQLDKTSADLAIGKTRDRVAKMLSGTGPGLVPQGVADMQRDHSGLVSHSTAMQVLTRRLSHIEVTAARVARLALRPLIENL